jgi:hypothetical protein
VPAVAARPLADITADALLADCGWCWGGWGNPCTTEPPGGMHLARYARACRRGLISDADMRAVRDAAPAVFTPGTVLDLQAVAA